MDINKHETNDLSANIDLLHTTELGMKRIKRNLSLSCDDVVDYLRHKITDKNCIIERIGKNLYCEIDSLRITINAYSYTIITAHKITENR